MSMELHLKQVQQLRMTPQLQQAIKLLQLSRVELADLIAQEMVENPVLEEHGENINAEQVVQEAASILDENTAANSLEPEKVAPLDEVTDASNTETQASEFMDNWEMYLENASSPLPTNNYRGMSSEDLPGVEQTLSKNEDLVENLTWQLRLSGFTDDERIVATFIIGNLDENGYFIGSTLEEIAEECECSFEFAEEVLELLQEFDPLGVCARDLKECLLIQAHANHPKDRNLYRVIDQHIPNLEKKRYDLIARDLSISMEEVIRTAKIISRMEPKPGRIFLQEEAQYITPDIHIIKVGDDYIATLNDDGIPKLKISGYYKDALSDGEVPDAKKYIQDKVKNAAWLIQSIYRRQRTIKRVTESIIKFQREFLEQGINHLKPLVLRDVADDIGMHESTISRVTTNKYVHTPQGIFELKYFFNSSISKVQGEDIASEAVKTKIKNIVDSENPKKPFSDAKIVKILHDQHNIDIARRTVAKYRDMLGILSSTKRKRLF